MTRALANADCGVRCGAPRLTRQWCTRWSPGAGTLPSSTTCELPDSTVAGTLTFPDHHAYSAADLHRIVRTAIAHGAQGVVTTGKDAVKMTGLETPALPFAAVPLTTQIEPAGAFAPWLLAQLARARQERSDARP
ncbi:MAG: tetraacyldisaccharide 4'-kinase [Vicinamibacterales bacterium]